MPRLQIPNWEARQIVASPLEQGRYRTRKEAPRRLMGGYAGKQTWRDECSHSSRHAHEVLLYPPRKCGQIYRLFTCGPYLTRENLCASQRRPS